MSLVGDRERERATASLRRHFVQGRLSIEELGTRAELALAARSRSDLRDALHDLPRPWETGAGSELVDSATAAVRRGVRFVQFVLLAGVWAFLSLSIAIAFAVSVAVFGSSLVVALVFLTLWAAVTFALWRPWLRSRRRAL
jgi:Flp pilus assembly protein TadB